MSEQEISLGEFAEYFDTDQKNIPVAVQDFFLSVDRKYKLLSGNEKEQAILNNLKNLEKPWLKRSEDENLEAFEKGWSENLELCKTDGISINSLTPKYVKPFELMRYKCEYIVPSNPLLFDDLCTATLLYIFHTYFLNTENIYEYGCGTGRYIYRLSQIYPEKHLVGLDWASASQEILKLMKQQSGSNIEGMKFNMLSPPSNFKMDRNSAMYTVGAMEQLGDRHAAFLDFILEQKPKVVVHHEPVEELYNKDNLSDYSAYLYHKHRGYLDGYLDRLKELEAEGKAKIIFAKKLGYGDKFNDGSSLVIWEPA